ncbi:pilus assembly protein [Chitinimonas sp. PSY-7]|uniref:PilC/PilY family type IV pilus protein n=1 Tax=Chitinimonas sp. PSY-7 TaxID=3459088 RepID=UPI00403FED2C
MQVQYRRKKVVNYVCLALSISPLMAFADEPYPSNPLILNSGVTPNIMLFVDTSTSMSAWMPTGSECKPGDPAYPKCANNGSIGIARRVLSKLVSEEKNKNLNWGLFTFDNVDVKRTGAGILQSPIKNRSNKKEFDELLKEIDDLYPDNSTPLAASTYELSRYWRGMTSAYEKNNGESYDSPIKYRCQKNYQIIISDGEPSWDTNLKPAAEDPALTNYNIENRAVINNVDWSQHSHNFSQLTKFMYQQDMRNTNSNDLEGKSFNEKKFEIQNVTSYVVGFRIDSSLLKNAAEQAGGKYYTISHGSDKENEEKLAESLSNAVASIIDQNSNAGGLAVEANAKSDNNFLYLPGFNSKGWYGELKRYSFHKGVINRDSMQEAGASLTKQASRKIYSATDRGKFNRFEFTEGSLGTMTQDQQAALGSDHKDRVETINFLRGHPVAGQRIRSTLLGDFIDTKPVFVGKPIGKSLDSSYENFKKEHSGRGMVFIGANDGMMHGFDTSKPITNPNHLPEMEEVVGYIPSMVYPKLKTLTNPNYGKGNNPHVYHVSGPSVTQDIKVNGRWKTILVSGLGQGGRGYFALDVTSQDNFKNPESTVRWEWNKSNDADVGYTFGTPFIYSVKTGSDSFTPVVVLANGYENNFDSSAKVKKENSSALYILNADSGDLIRKIEVNEAGGRKSTGLSSPRGLDADFDGVLDYVYAGDENGTMWRFDLTSGVSSASVKPIFQTPKEEPIIQAPRILPVRGKASTENFFRENDKGFKGYLVLFGTGRLLTNQDRQDSTQHYFFGVLDDLQNKDKVNIGDLTEQKLISNGSYRAVTDNPIDLEAEPPTSKGWFIKFSSYERLVSEPQLHGRRIMFGTGIPQAATETQTCASPSKGWIMALDALTGSTVRTKRKIKYAFLDQNGNGKSDVGDLIKFGKEDHYPSGYRVDGIPKDPMFMADKESTITLTTDTSIRQKSASGTAKENNWHRNNVAYSKNGGVDMDTNAGGESSGRGGSDCSQDNSTKGIYLSANQGSESIDSKIGNAAPGCGVRLERVTWRELVN